MSIIKQKPMDRGAGILLPISCLSSPYGIGSFGVEAYEFIDFLKASGQKYWQVLPLGPTSYGDSPYQSFSAFAGNPYYIDLDILIEEDLLNYSQVQKINWGSGDKVNYSILFNERFKLLRAAYKKSEHKEKDGFKKFCIENENWLEDYCLFMAIKTYFGNESWLKWPEDIRIREPKIVNEYAYKLKDDIDFWKFCQYKFYTQWEELKEYASENSIKIIGDVPIYVAADSADVWVNYRLFDLDEERHPLHVAGVPPDLFSATGQLWGNPLYNWKQMEKEDFKWWKERMQLCAKIYDVIRIDHFIGIVNYYSIPSNEESALNGKWIKGPGEKLVNAINSAIGDKRIIAEDLGVVTQEVKELIENSGYPGMKLLEMAFDSGSSNEYLPFHYDRNIVVYGGTHDNETLAGYFEHQNKELLEFACDFLNIKTDNEIPWAIIYAAYQSIANTVIFLMQDLLMLGNSARINTPSTIGGNWTWRLVKGQITDRLSQKLNRLTQIYGR